MVLDAQTGRVIALASAPDVRPGGLDGRHLRAEYRRLLSDKYGKPLVSRAIKGEFAPGSTFKVSSVSAMLRDGYPLNGQYDCPGVVHGGRPGRSTTSAASGSAC